ncbi:MAG: hypothetical protein K9J42_04870 [Sulfuritalea sp.]|nr:hypothetical protein [Sulfuritalea sp.]
MSSKSRPLILSAALLALLLILLAWYRGGGTPLSPQEVDRYVARIEAQKQVPGGRHHIAELRSFLASDDGKAFYTVNLYRYFARAHYLSPQAGALTGRAAYDRFSRVMIPLQARFGSHAVFGTDWMNANPGGWDRLVIVRYRSRRDIAEIFASDEFAEASADKWASLERNERLLVQGVHLPELIAIALPASAALALYLAVAGLRRAFARQSGAAV